MKKRISALLLAFVMTISLLPVSALAANKPGDGFGSGFEFGTGDFGRFQKPTLQVSKTLDAKVRGTGITVSATSESIPNGARLVVEQLNGNEAQKYFDAIGEELLNPVALDITIMNGDEEWQPEEGQSVEVSITKIGATLSNTVYHFTDEAEESAITPNAAKPVKAPAQALNYETLTGEADGSTATVTTEHFSVYVISDDDGVVTPTITFEFYDGQGDANNGLGNPYEFLNTAGQTVTSQIIKDGEKLQAVPAPGLNSDGNAFNGWFYADGEKAGQEVNFDEVFKVTKDDTIKIVANYGDVIYVTFWQYALGKVVLERKQIAKTDGKYTFDLATVSVPAPKPTLKFMGWSLFTGSEDSEETGDTVGSRALLTEQASENDNNAKTNIIAFEGNTNVYPVYYSGLWITFQSAAVGAGASYREPYFLAADSADASKAKPEDPTMTGYKFDGWYTKEEPRADYNKTEAQAGNAYGEKFDFSTSFGNLSRFVDAVTGEVMLYGHWSPGPTTYTVVYWKQQVSNDKNATGTQKTYDYADQLPDQPGTTGDNVTPTADQMKADAGFTFNRYELVDKDGNQITGIAADGSSILNVYFDRNLITMNFGQTDWWGDYSISYSYTGLYGQTLEQNGYTWPEGQWSYYKTNNDTGIMTYLGQFVLPNDVRDAEKKVINLYISGSANNKVVFYLQAADGSYPTSGMPTGELGSGGFSFSDKYDGYKVVAYRFERNGKYYAGERQNYGSWYSPDYYYGPSSSSANADNAWTAVTASGDPGNHTYAPATVINYRPNGSNVYNLHIKYERENYTIRYLNPLNESEVLTAKTLPFGASLKDAKPTASSLDLKTLGYEWDGKWYKDRTCKEEFDFDTETMPLGGTKVYAGSTQTFSYVKFDPNGGELKSGQRTYSWFYYNQPCNTYDSITRDFIEYKPGDSDGPYYYYYDEFDTNKRQEIWDGEYMAENPRNAYYTTNADAGDFQKWLNTDTQYSKEVDAYALIGWYDVTDGEDNMTPFKSGTGITRDTILKAMWRRTGEYKVLYAVEAVDASGSPLMKGDARVMGSDSPNDNATYADQSDSAIMDKLKVPTGYNFVGWYYNNKIYQPGDVFQVQARLADEHKYVTIYPVLEPVETLPVAVTDITFDPNGGAFTAAADTEINAMIAAAVAGETRSSENPYNPELEKNTDGTWTLKNLKINEGFDVLSAAAVENGVVINGEKILGRGYILKEWNTKADGSGETFALGVKAGVDGVEPLPNTLYAIWREVFYVYHTSDNSFQIVDKNDLTNRQNLVKEGNYYGGFSVYAAGASEAPNLTFSKGEASGEIQASYWSRTSASKFDTNWKANDTGAVYVIKEVPISYLAKPTSVAIKADYGNGDVKALTFLSVTDTNIYRKVGIKFNDDKDIRGNMTKTYTLSKNNGATTIYDAQKLFGMEGYLAIYNVDPKAGDYTNLQAYWVTYDNVTVYAVDANIKDIITIN